MIDKEKVNLNMKKQWAKFVAVLVLYLLFLWWLQSWLGLVVVPFIYDVYISKKSYLIKMTVNVLGKTFFSNYRSVHGIVFPHRIEIINAYGKAVGDVLSIKQNPSIEFDRLKITP